MGFLSRYAATVTAGAVLCSVLLSISRNGSHHTLLRFLCGLCFAVILIRPLADRKWEWEPETFRNAAEYGRQLSAAGTDKSREALSRDISRRLEEYILEKAASLDTALSVTVTLGEDNLPEMVYLRGSCAPGTKAELASMMETDLGISKENQLWTG